MSLIPCQFCGETKFILCRDRGISCAICSRCGYHIPESAIKREPIPVKILGDKIAYSVIDEPICD